MSRSRLLSVISLALVGSLTCVAVGCSGPTCGPGDAPDTLVASSGEISLTYGHFYASPNNDCGVSSLTIFASQTDASGQLLTLCVPDPDKLANAPQALGDIQIVDFNGAENGCSYSFDSSRPPSGTVSVAGLCDSGRNHAGFALTLMGGVSLTKCPPGESCDASCGGTSSVPVQVSGVVAVGPPM